MTFKKGASKAARFLTDWPLLKCISKSLVQESVASLHLDILRAGVTELVLMLSG